MNLKKIISAFMAFGIAAGMSALNVSAAADNGFTTVEISTSEIKPYITLTKQVIPSDYIFFGKTVTVQVMVDTEDYSYATTGLHIYYDPSLSIRTDSLGQIDVKKGEAAENLTFEASEDPTAEDYGMKGIFISTTGDYNGGKSGVLAEITFNLPTYLCDGDVFYPLDIIYKEGDAFTTFDNDDTGKLMQAWTFTRGIYSSKYNNNFHATYDDIGKCRGLEYIYGSYDGYIAIENLPVTTTTMATTTRTTMSTTNTTTTTTNSYTMTARPTTTVPYTTTSHIMTTRPTTTMTYTTTSHIMTTRPTTTMTYTMTERPTTTVSYTTESHIMTTRPTTTLSYTTAVRTTTTAPAITTTTAKPNGISIIPDKITMDIGDTNRLALIGTANPEDIIWTSGNTSVASVDSDGNVTAKKAGKAEIFAVYNNQSVSCIVTVVSGDITGVTLIGDANGDGEISVADATLILQYCGNKDKYKISEQGLLNADVDGTPGISAMDALIIQQVDAGIYNISDLPLTK